MLGASVACAAGADLGGSLVAPDDEDGLPHLAERLNVLFAHVPRPDGPELYSNERAAEDLTSGGVSVTPGYLRQLRSGKRRNPTARLLGAIARLFDVPITYFFDDRQADAVAQQLQNLTRLRAAGVRGIVARSAAVTPQDIDDLGIVLDEIRRLESGDSPDPEPNGG